MANRMIVVMAMALLLAACEKKGNPPVQGRTVAAIEAVVKNDDTPVEYDTEGIEVERAFINADVFTFYTVDPESHYKPDLENDDAVEKLRGWVVLGKVEVTDKTDRRKLLAAMQRGIEDSDGTAAGCFNPRHAIHIESGDDSIDYVICFECLQVAVHYGTGERESHQTTAGPAPIFNAYAKSAELEIAP